MKQICEMTREELIRFAELASDNYARQVYVSDSGKYMAMYDGAFTSFVSEECSTYRDALLDLFWCLEAKRCPKA